MDKRLELVRDSLSKWSVDGVLITSPANRRWLSGFTGSAGKLLVTSDKAVLSTDSRYWEQAAREAPEFEIYRQSDAQDVKFLSSAGASRIGFESNHMTIGELNFLQEVDGLSWTALAVTAEAFRPVKSAAELKLIRKAARITDATVAEFPKLAKPGVSEKSVAWELEKFMRESGADRAAFDIIVAAGPNSALPHHHPGDRELTPGDIVIVDLGAEVGGYKSDLTRTFYLGDSADDKFWEIYDAVLKAQLAAIGGIREGVSGKEIDSLARDIIAGAGYAENFGHGTGHSLGIEIHEFPRFSKNGEKDIMSAGMVMTVEPGIYLPGYGGVRIEDLVLVTPDGHEYLSAAPKSPLIKV